MAWHVVKSLKESRSKVLLVDIRFCYITVDSETPAPWNGASCSTQTLVSMRICQLCRSMRIRIQHCRSMQVRTKGFDDQKLLNFKADQKNFISWSKNTIYLFLVLHEGRPSLQPSKENIQHFKSWNLNFFLFLWVFFIFDLLDPDAADQNRLKLQIILMNFSLQ